MTTTPDIDCGPFRLLEPIGAGGMGEVYLARHAGGGRAAVKLLTKERARDERYRAAFRREIHALARLNHPGVATIHDFGFVEGEAADGPVPDGTPWFAMEHIDGPTVDDAATQWQWPAFRDFALALLDALAHAHARHVLHRDLKPSNVLLRGGSAGEIALVDFGIAELFRVESEGEESQRADSTYGTPPYMAPEQILGKPRRQGPWTDLYAVGCLLWNVACGDAPHPGKSTQEILKSHLGANLGPFRPRFPVPGGLESWLRGMLHKAPEQRGRRAADASRALLALDIPSPSGRSVSEPPAPASGPVLTTLVDETVADFGDERTELREPTFWDGDGDERGGLAASASGPFPSPTVPEKWRRKSADGGRPSARMGMNLFGLRKLPFVDRDDERRRLWEALRSAADRERPEAVLVHGPAGCGKSRLIDWITERAHETGAATPIRVTHSRPSAPTDGLASALARWFRCSGLDWSEAVDRLTEEFGHLGIDGQARLVDSVGLLRLAGTVETPDSSSSAGFHGADERNRALARIVGALAERRPVILWLDDVLRDPRTVSFVRHLCGGAEGLESPVVAVMTSRNDELAEVPEIADDLRRLAASALEVEPLDRPDHARLIQSMLPFDDALVERLAERTEGHPLFAVQIVRDWVERGRVEQRDGRVVFTGDREEAVPADLHRLWRRRVERLLRDGEWEADAGRRALELGATLGKSVDRREWRAVCRDANLSVPAQLVDRLIESGLASSRENGWTFAHGLLVESLRRFAQDAGRFQEHHRRCARVLETLYDEQDERAAERRADHLVEAGRPLEAYEPLTRAAMAASARGDFGRKLDLLDRQADVLGEAGVDENDWRRAENAVARSGTHLDCGNPAESERLAERVREWTRRHSGSKSKKIEASAIAKFARLASARGEYAEALSFIDRAEQLTRELDDDEGLAICLRKRGFYLWQLNDHERARAVFRQGRELSESLGERRLALKCDWNIAWCWIEEGEYGRVREITDRLLREARDLPSRGLEASGYNLLGELARFDNDWREAARCYEEAATRWRQNGARAAVIARLNRVLVAVGARQWDVVERECEVLWSQLAEQGFASRRPQVSLCLAIAATVRGDDDGWRKHLRALERGLEEHSYRGRDLPWLAEQGAAVCAEHGEPARARRLTELEATLWRDLGADKKAEKTLDR